MKLVSVVYEQFEWEAEWPDEHFAIPVQQLDRQIRLTDDNGNNWYISWGERDTVIDDYGIGFSEHSFFDPSLYPERDMTNSAMWTDVAGNVVTCQFTSKWQVEIRAGNQIVYCYVGGDVLFISRQPSPF